MKGGSATKMILESILSDALVRMDAHSAGADVAGSAIWTTLREYETAVRHVYCHSEGISKLVELAGVSLREGGRLLCVHPLLLVMPALTVENNDGPAPLFVMAALY